MEFLDCTYTNSEVLNIANLSALSKFPSPDECFSAWADQSSASTVDHSPSTHDGGTSSSNSPLEFEVDIQKLLLDGDISQYTPDSWGNMKGSRWLSRPADLTDDATFQRILVILNPSLTLEPITDFSKRRRTQNRNAQRSYRKQREDNRKILEERLKVAEDDCQELKKTCTELNLVVLMLGDQLKMLEAENTAFRTSASSLAWMKKSL